MAQTIISQPPIRESFQDEKGNISRAWSAWMQQAFRVLFSATQSGTTAQRPADTLYPGKPYFDQSLGAHGKAIFVNKDATGWVDSSGNVV